MLYLYLILMTGPSFLSAALQQLSLPEFVQLIFFELQHRYVKSCEGSEIFLIDMLTGLPASVSGMQAENQRLWG